MWAFARKRLIWPQIVRSKEKSLLVGAVRTCSVLIERTLRLRSGTPRVTSGRIGYLAEEGRLTAMLKDYDELPAEAAPPRISVDELSRIIDFVEQLEDETDAALGLQSSSRELRILVHLMRNHIAGRLTTQSSLVAASGLAYGTALRAIQSLVDRGMVMKRPRTKTGKTFSLHPTPALIQQWKVFARRLKGIVGGVFGWSNQKRVTDDYYFGASYMCAQVIPQPSVLAESLQLNKIRMLIHADPTFLAMSSVKRQLESILGAPIQNKALSIDRLYREIYNNATLPRSKFDIIACNLPWFGKLATDGILLPLNDMMEEDRLDLSDFHPEPVNSARLDGIQYGIPVQTAPELLFFRRDLFDEAGLPEPHEASQVVEAARRLHRLRYGLCGIAWNAARGTPIGHTFIMTMAAFGQPIIDLRSNGEGFIYKDLTGEQHRPMFQTEAAKRTAEYLLELLPYSPSNILNMSWYERGRCYANGECAMTYCYTLNAPLFLNDKSSPAQKTSGVLPHPHGPNGRPVAPVGGYALAIPANVDPGRAGAIWTVLRTLTSAEATKQYVLNGSTSSPRFSVGGDSEVARVCPLIGLVDQMARNGVLQAWPRPPIPELQDIVAIVGAEIHDMLCGRNSVAGALDNVQNRADAVMRQNGHY
jgi:multiple sugar transport system substrate-binding protein